MIMVVVVLKVCYFKIKIEELIYKEAINALDIEFMGGALTVDSAVKNVTSKDWKGNTVLMQACKLADEKLALGILEECDKLDIKLDLDAVNWRGESALIIACRKKLPKVASVLIRKGAKLDIQSSNGSTALIWASRNCMHDVVDTLLDWCADPTLKTIKGDSMLRFILSAWYDKDVTDTILKYLKVADMYNIKLGSKNPLLLPDIMGSCRLYDDLVCKLIDMRVNCEGKTNISMYGYWCRDADLLENACLKGYVKTVKKLLELQKNTKFRVGQGKYLLKLAIVGRRGKEIMFFLLDFGACFDENIYNHFVGLLDFAKDYDMDQHVVEYITEKHPEQLEGINMRLNLMTKKRMQEEIDSLRSQVSRLG